MDPQVHPSQLRAQRRRAELPDLRHAAGAARQGAEGGIAAGVTGRVTLSPERVQMAGIKTVAIGYRPMVKQIKTVGYITFDESGLSRIVSRVDGYVEKLYVDKSYTMVHKGEPLAEIYSPELYSAAQGDGPLAQGARGRPTWRLPLAKSSSCWASRGGHRPHDRLRPSRRSG